MNIVASMWPRIRLSITVHNSTLITEIFTAFGNIFIFFFHLAFVVHVTAMLWQSIHPERLRLLCYTSTRSLPPFFSSTKTTSIQSWQAKLDIFIVAYLWSTPSLYLWDPCPPPVLEYALSQASRQRLPLHWWHKLNLQKLQNEDDQAKNIRAEGEDWDGVLHHQGLSIIQTELISRHHNGPLVSHFGIEKTCELVARKYYWNTLCHDVKSNVKECDVCMALKAVKALQWPLIVGI